MIMKSYRFPAFLFRTPPLFLYEGKQTFIRKLDNAGYNEVYQFCAILAFGQMISMKPRELFLLFILICYYVHTKPTLYMYKG